jgi:hypothetical protein
MAIKTATEMVEAIDDAIFAILEGAQSHSIKDRQFTLADLDTLREMRKEYLPLAQQEGRGNTGMRTRQVMPIG